MQAFVHAPLPTSRRRVTRPGDCCSRRRWKAKAEQEGPRIARRALLKGAALLAGERLLRVPGVEAFPLFGSQRRTKLAEESSAAIFSVIPTSVSDVNLVPVGFEQTLADASKSDALFLGEHHNSLVDHALQSRIIDALRSRRKLMVGLEMVQQQYQPVLDKYVKGEIGELELYLGTEWETRWVWPYELYLPVLRLCRKHKIPLVALSVDSETLRKVRVEGGITNLSAAELREHIGDPGVFAAISKDEAFKVYMDECITPSYATHSRMGLLHETSNFTTFYTSRVLRDEAMATRAVHAMTENPNALLVCLLGADHVKFEYGVKARVQGQLAARRVKETAPADGTTPNFSVPNPPRLRTVMLNPSPADAFDARDHSLKLEMAVGDNPIPISDYLWFSSVAEAKPRRRSNSNILPPVERLTKL